MMANLIFKAGMPYGPDVRRLMEEFPPEELIEGKEISHIDIEKIIGYAKGTARYYGVVNSWFTHERTEHNIVIVWNPPDGAKILAPAEVLEFAETKVHQKAKGLGRATRKLTWVDRDRLNDTGRQRLDHQLGVAAKIGQYLNSIKKEMAIALAPVKSLPRRPLQKD
jgi:hypothetical protein